MFKIADSRENITIRVVSLDNPFLKFEMIDYSWKISGVFTINSLPNLSFYSGNKKCTKYIILPCAKFNKLKIL